MSKLRERLKKYTLVFYWVLVFIVTASMLFLILPGEPKFKYEYQKGFPWRHENLVAPFDFAILKSAQELEKEKAEQLKLVVPYFTFDTTICQSNIEKLKTDLLSGPDSLNSKKTQIVDTIESYLKQIYKIGILQTSPEFIPELRDKTELKKRTGNLITNIPITKLYSEKSAYNELAGKIQNLKIQNPKFLNWFANISLKKYIVSNLSFDEATTQKETDERFC